MNAFEQEYRLNVERAKERELKRVLWACAVVTCAALLGFGAFAVATRDGFTRDVSRLAEMVAGVLLAGATPLLSLALVAAAIRLAKWQGDRNVVVTTTDRERSYRAPTEPENAVVISAPPWRRVIRVAVVAVVFFVGAASPAFRPSLGHGERALVAVGVALVAGVILLAKRLYGAWRSRRNARLELRWERWLDSADSCQVGPRKWTK